MSELSRGPPGPEQFPALDEQSSNLSISHVIDQPVNQTNNQPSYSSIVQQHDQISSEPIEPSIAPSFQQSTQPMNESVDESIDQSIGQPIEHSVNQPIEDSVNQISDQSIQHSVNQSVDQLDQQTHVNPSSELSQLDYQSINPSIHTSFPLTINPSMTFQQSLTFQTFRAEAMNQQHIDQSNSLPSNQSFDESVNRFIEQSINQSIHQSITQSLDPSLNQSLDQSGERQYARKALLAVGDRAIKLIDNTRGSNVIMRYSIDTVSNLGRFVPGKARSFTVNQWSNYGDPLLNKIDAKLDEAMNAIANATSGLQAAYEYTQAPRSSSSQSIEQSSDQLDEKMSEDVEKPVFARTPMDQADGSLVRVDAETDAYWNRLKDKFVASHWYRHVDSILLQNSVVKALTHRMVRPAEVFFNTVTEEFLTHQSQEEFLTALQQRVGPAWDDRLAPLAKGFYTTAKAVSAVVGAGKFVGGALQLGRTKAHSVVEELLEHWDRVLGLGNNLVDRWLPDSQRASRMLPSAAPQANDSQQLKIDGSPQSLARSGKKRVRRPGSQGVADEYSSNDSDQSDSEMIDDASMNTSNSPRLRSRKQLKSQLPFASSSLGIPRQTESSLDSSDDSDDVSTSDEDEDDSSDDEEEKSLTHFATPPSTDRTGGVLIAKVGARLRQRIPSMSIFGLTTLTVTFTSDLKNRLTDHSWFTLVDDILMQNALVKTLASLVRPAEHFFNTALHMFSTHVFKSHRPKTPQLPLPAHLAELGMDDSSSEDEDDMPIRVSVSTRTSQSPPILITSRTSPGRRDSPCLSFTTFTQSFTRSSQSVTDATVPTTQLALETLADDFVYQLRVALGRSWDERLLDHARQFYHTAYEVRPNANITTSTTVTNGNETQFCA